MANHDGENATSSQKQDDFQPNLVKDQLPGVTYCLTSPPPRPETILLGFQHYLVMLGTTVFIPTMLVSMIGAENDEKVKLIQRLLFVSGLNMLLQSFFGTRFPAVIGASYSYVSTTTSIILPARYNDILDPQEKFENIMCGIQGALIIASLLQICVLKGERRMERRMERR